MPWLIAIISAYFLYAIVALADKYLLKSAIPSPKVYCFYVGILGISALFLIPLGFSIPQPFDIAIALLAGAISILAILKFYTALKKFDVSVVIPSIGGILPVFTFFLSFYFLKERGTIEIEKISAFILLVLGSILIGLEEKKSISLKSLQASALAAFLFSLTLILSKFVYIRQETFWSGFIWMRIGAFAAALFLLFSKEVREEIFKKRVSFKKETITLFFSSQAIAAFAFILQNWAIYLAPVIYLATINALEGTKYLFLLIILTLLSIKYKGILKEEISRENFLQKLVSILLISVGLAILAFK